MSHNEDPRRTANFRRFHCCKKCGSPCLETVDGAKVGGMPGINYRYCGACGHANPIVKLMSRREMREGLRK